MFVRWDGELGDFERVLVADGYLEQKDQYGTCEVFSRFWFLVEGKAFLNSGIY